MRNKKQRAKISARILAVLLCVCLAAQNVPMNAFAAETAQGQTQERSAGEFTSELSSEPFSESAEEATEEQAEETVQETVPEKIEEEEQDSTERVNSDSATETIEQTSEHESYRISEEASIAEESICEESATDNESSSETDSITEEWSQTEIDNFSGETVSRIEWLRELTSAFELNLEKENYPDNYYSDISTSSEYYHDIMVATGYGLVDVDAGEEFRPDDNATREFAAYSMNMRVGYVRESSEYTFSEAGEVTHADDIQAAIDNGWMVLDGSDFHPNAALTVEVKDAMIKEAKEIYASRKIDANHENRYEFTDNVIVIPNDTLIELSAENELTITDCPKTINQGDMFAVFDSGMPLVFRAEKISKSGSQTIVTIGDVDMEDAFTTFDMEGTIDTDLTSVFVEDDDETVQLNYIVGGSAEKQYEDGTKYESLEELGNREISAVQVVQEFDYEEVNNGKWFGKPGGNYEESNPACKFTITQTISDLDVNYISNGTSSVYLTVTGNVSINCSLNLDLLDAFMPDLKVIKIQVTPLAVTLDLDAVVTLKGKAVFNYDGFFEIGVDFKHNRGFKLVSHLYGDTFSTEINAEATVGLRASINANYVFIKGSLYAEMGLKGGVTVLNKDDNGEPKECTTIYAYLYANYGWSVKVFVLFDKDKKWSDSHAIYTKYNSPFRVSKHYENGKKVDCCTRSRKSLQEYKAGPMWFYSTPSNSKYGYNGGSSGLDADGNPFTIFEYSLNEDNEATITKYNGNVSALRIPEELDGYKVVGIGNSVFKGKTALRTVVVPDSVETIGYSAFENCSNLVSVQLPKGVTSIGYYAFRNCSKLKKVEIPKSLETTTANFYLTNSGIFYDCENLKTIKFEEGITKIPQCIFANCSGIESIEIPDTVISIEAYAFYNCASIKNIQISNAVTSIEAYAFSKCNELSQIEIPNSVTNIAECAFSSCGKLSNIKLSKGLKIIGYYAFRDCNGIKEIEIPKSLETTTANFYLMNSGIFYDCENLKTIKFEEGITKIPQCIFANCSGIEDVEIPDTVTSIEAYAFYNCASIKNIQISNAVTSIEAYAFSKCNELSQIEIPNSVTNIAECAFSSCGKLSNIKLSKGLKIIGYYAFRDCNGIKEIEIPKSLETTTADFYLTNSGIFYDCENLKTIKFEEGITKIPQCIFANCSGIEDVEIPDTVTSIEAYAFYNCKSLKNIILKIGIETIGGYTFTNDSALLGISIPDTVTSMGNYIFSGCTSLKTARLPNTRVNITDGMFQNCTSLTTIALPKTVTTIKQYAFQNAGLTELTLPENVTTIEQSAFDNCTALAKVTLNQKLKTIGNYAFRNNDALSEITIPNSVTTIGDYAFQDSDALTTATISDSVTAIGQYIFAHCDTLKDIKLGTGLTKIPSYAFNLCPELQKIVLPYRITTVDANAFTNCTKLTEVTIPRGTTTISANAFSYPDRLTIYGISGTYAEIYANQIGAKFVNREVNATNVTLSSTTLSMIAGAKHTLVMSVTPNDFTDEVVWKSSDTNILTVDNMGVITAKAVGTANVRVAVGEKTASCAVTVVQPVTSISLNRSTLSLDAFEDYTLTASVYPDNAADKSVEWTTSDEKIAIVSQTGKVTPLSKGTADITVTAKDGSGRTAKCTVTVTSEGQLCTQYSQLESAHNYANNTNKVWKYTYSGAKTLEVTFDSKTNVDDGYDFIYIYDKDNKEIKKATGTQLAGKTIQTTGDTVKIKLVSDEAVTAWGFRVTKISADGTAIDPGEENPGETETSTEGSTEGSSEEENSSEEHSTETEPDEPDGSLKDGLYITGLKTKTYTGSAVKQNLKVYYNKNLLQEGKDYTLSYKNNKTAGTALVMIKTKGNLTGVVTKTFQIQPRKINDTNVIIEDAVYSYDKKAHKKAPAVMYNGKKLKEGKDYQAVEYGTGDYTSVGTYRVKIKGIGNYAGTYDSAKVIIVDKDKNLSKAKVAKVPAQEYQNGAAVELPDSLVKVELNKTTLKKGSDYTVSYANNTEAGKAILIIKGKGQYAGTKTITFTIKRTPTVLTDSMVTNKKEIGTVEIHKNGAKPKPKLATGGSALTEGKDYAISYKNNKKAGTGTIVIKGKGNYTGNLEIPFRITVKDLTSPNITVRVPNVPYTGKPNKYQSALVLTDSDGGILAKNKDYTVEAYYMGKTVLDKKSNPKEGAEITVIIKGKGNYTGTIETSYSVKGIDFSKADIKVTAKRYTGSSVIIKSDDIISANIKTGKTKTALKFGTDYEIAAYSNNLKKGTATVTFKGIGAYAGEKTVKFKINSAQVQ